MPRLKEYDRTEVLEKAASLFLEKGYKGTSMNDLVDFTGIHRRSMYTEFDGKEDLFLECIESYLKTTISKVVSLLQQKPLGLENIKSFLQNRIDYAVSGNCKGCLLVNTVVERDSVSKDVENRVARALKITETELYKCLQSAQADGDIAPAKDCHALAKYLMCFLQGLMVLGKLNPSKSSLDSVLDTVLGAL